MILITDNHHGVGRAALRSAPRSLYARGAVEARTTNVESTTIGFMPSCTLIRRNRPTISSTASDAVSLRGIRTDVKAGVTSELTGMSSMPITDT